MYFGYRRYPMRTAKTLPSTMFPINMIFAAASAAQRINGEYVKWGQPTEKPLNSKIMRNLLNAPDTLLPEDYENGEKVRLHYAGMLTKVFDGSATDFTSKVFSITQLSELGDRDPNFGLAACLPSCYERDLNRQAQQDQRFNVSADSTPLAYPLNSKVALTINIIDCKFSQKYNVNVINAAAGTHLLFFFSANGWEIGKTYSVTGKVKRFDGNTTQLNYVKVAK